MFSRSRLVWRDGEVYLRRGRKLIKLSAYYNECTFKAVDRALAANDISILTRELIAVDDRSADFLMLPKKLPYRLFDRHADSLRRVGTTLSKFVPAVKG